jgi:hypothetical protein
MFFVLVVVGVALYLVNAYVPMESKIKTILTWAVVIGVLMRLASGFGLFDALRGIHVGR